MSERVINVGDKSYPVARQPFIGDLRLLKAEFGFGWGTVVERLRELGEADFIKALDDEELLDALVAWIWMARLRAGEREATRTECEMLGLDEITFSGGGAPDQDDEALQATPTSAPTDSARGGDEGKAKPGGSTPSSTKTSRKRSTAA